MSACPGSSGWPRSTRRSSGATCGTGPCCAPMAAFASAETSSSRRCWAPRSSRSAPPPRRARLRHGAPVPPRHLPDRHRHPARRPAGEVRRYARSRSSATSMALAEDVRRELAAIGARASARSSVSPRPSSERHPGRQTIDHGALASRPTLDRERGARRASPVSGGHRHTPVASVGGRDRAAWPSPDGFGRAGARLGHLDDRRPGVRCPRWRVPCAARGDVATPVILRATGAAGQSLGAFLTEGLELDLEGIANDYVAKGLSGGVVIVRPEPTAGVARRRQSIAGNTCLYGATAGRLHLVGEPGSASPSATVAPRRSSRASARTAAST